MPKNLIVLSDGTGNSAAAVWRTNVWRVYEALDLSRPDQIAFYDDGVGTSSFKPLALLGSAFGWGLKRNLIDEYAFLCRNYQAGDHIYCFGFSRGAFTVRRLVAMVTAMGLLDARDKSDALLWREARTVYREFRRSGKFYLSHAFVWMFRLLRDAVAWMLNWLREALAQKTFAPNIRKVQVPPDRKRVPIKFLGVWDTVAAYGLPMYEMTRAIDLYYLPMSMQDRSLSDSVERACHALSLDDERTTFQPLLWSEDGEPKVFGGPDSQNITRIDQERLSQVWFAGMHANVGGGYPDDGMAHVPLDWIAGEAEKRGLVFKGTPVVQNPGPPFSATQYVTTNRDAIRAKGDPSGRIYNSRAGLGGYYRYGPRRLEDLTNDDYNEVVIPLPKIHESVFDRLKLGVGGYAPFVLPKVYSVVRWDGSIEHGTYESSAQSESRAHQQEGVWDWVWGRRIVYFLTLFATLYVAASPLSEMVGELVYKKRTPWIDNMLAYTLGLFSAVPRTVYSFTESISSWRGSLPTAVRWPLDMVANAFEHVASKLVGPTLDVASSQVPQFLKPWLDSYRQHPTWFAFWVIIVTLLIYIGVRMENRINGNMRDIWNPIVAAGPAPLPVAAIAPAPNNRIYRLRTSGGYREFIHRMKQWILPTIFALIFAIVGIAAAGTLTLYLAGMI